MRVFDRAIQRGKQGNTIGADTTHAYLLVHAHVVLAGRGLTTLGVRAFVFVCVCGEESFEESLEMCPASASQYRAVAATVRASC